MNLPSLFAHFCFGNQGRRNLGSLPLYSEALVNQRATTKIDEETKRWPDVETGGVLMGRVSEASRTVHVVDVLDAPQDSTRSATKFVLGTEGLRQQMEEYSETIHWSLYCLGTWHSHLFSSGPSTTDLATAKMVLASV